MFDKAEINIKIKYNLLSRQKKINDDYNKKEKNEEPKDYYCLDEVDISKNNFIAKCTSVMNLLSIRIIFSSLPALKN